VHLDYVGVKLFTRDGRLEGELRIVGLFTSDAYTSTTNEVPYLRRKVGNVVTRARFDPASHAGRALLNVLENYPRDELFQIDENTLYHFALDIMALSERPRIRALPAPTSSTASSRARVHPEGPLRQRHPPPCRRVPGRRFPGPRVRRPTPTIRKGRSPARTSSSAATAARRRRSIAIPGARIGGIVRTWAMPCAISWPLHRRLTGARARQPLRQRLQTPPIAEAFGPRPRWPTSPSWSSSPKRARARSISTVARATPRPA
jgi:hypothetical protein